MSFLSKVAGSAMKVTESAVKVTGSAVGAVKDVLPNPISAATAMILDSYGEESLEMLQALAAIVQKTAIEELSLHRLQYSLLLALPLINIADSTLPPPACGEELDLESDLGAQARRWVDFAWAAYGARKGPGAQTDEERVAQRLGDKVQSVSLAFLPERGVQCPGHFVALDVTQRVVVLGIRGTVNLSDAITDAVGNSVPLPGYEGAETHQAILAAAGEVLKRTRAVLDEALVANEGFGVVITGHSLGAGTAILAALMLEAEPLHGKPKLRCFAYAPPPVVAPEILDFAEGVQFYSFVNRHDIVPRISLHNCFMLGHEALEVDSMDLSLLQRLNLIRKGASAAEGDSEQEGVKEAVERGRSHVAGMKMGGDYVPHFIPGQVFWMNPDAEGGVKVMRTSARELQGLLLKGGSAAMKDHGIARYQDGLRSFEALRREEVAAAALYKSKET